MLLHLTNDEKFIDHVIDVFEAVNPDQNIYIIPTEKGSEPKHVKRRGKNVVIDDLESERIQGIIKGIEGFDAVILHNLFSDYKYPVVLGAPENVHFHWMCWGGDLYSLPALKFELYEKETNRYLINRYGFKWYFESMLRKKLSFVTSGLSSLGFMRELGRLKQTEMVLARVKSVSTVIPSEHELVVKYVSDKIKYLPFRYVTIEDILKGEEEELCKGDDFLLGNSATVSNNHLDAFKVLKETASSSATIYCPLSYGDSEYADYIAEQGKKLFGASFHALRDFMPLSAYNEILAKCGNVVMFHKRQQGLGNIIVALWKGARVFLHKENPIYSFLKKEGAIVYTISDLANGTPLPPYSTLAATNRAVLGRMYGKQNVLREVRVLVDYLTSGIRNSK